MAYSVVANIRAQTPFKSSTLISDAEITQKIAEADGMIDSYIGQVYTLPLSETPEIIKSISKDLSAVMLYDDQNKNFEVQPGININDEWERILSALKSIQSRELKLYDTAGSELTLADRIKPKFYPTEASSASDSTEQTGAKFTINQDF